MRRIRASDRRFYRKRQTTSWEIKIVRWMRMILCRGSVACGLLLAGLPVYGQAWDGSQYGPNVHYEHNVTMKTRDGVVLRADLYRPAAEGKYPTLLQRTPYNKDGAVSFALRAVARGFMVVVQDVRGR